MSEISNWVDYINAQNKFEQEDTFLRKRSVFTGYDHHLAAEIIARLAFPTSDFNTPQSSQRYSYIEFLAARSLTAGRHQTLTAQDWLNMLSLQTFIDTYEIHTWEAAELILDGQSPGDFALLEEMQWVGEHLDNLLRHAGDFHFPAKGVPVTPEISQYHDQIASPLKSIIEQIAQLEARGIDLMGDDDPLDLIKQLA